MNTTSPTLTTLLQENQLLHSHIQQTSTLINNTVHTCTILSN